MVRAINLWIIASWELKLVSNNVDAPLAKFILDMHSQQAVESTHCEGSAIRNESGSTSHDASPSLESSRGNTAMRSAKRRRVLPSKEFR